MADAISSEDFKACMSNFASGVTIVTTVDQDGTPWGLTVSAFSSLSLDPPLCLVCIARRPGSLEAFRTNRRFAVNMLSDKQEEISNRFASRHTDKFADTDWKPGPVLGCPVFADVLAWTECEVTEVLPGGDHDIFVGQLGTVEAGTGQPLLYFNGAYGDLTSRPKNW